MSAEASKAAPDFKFWAAATHHELTVARYGAVHPQSHESRLAMYRALDAYITDRVSKQVLTIVDRLADRLIEHK